jgi:hypothetical protein
MGGVGDVAALRSGLDRLLGTAWDAELDVYRRAGEGLAAGWLSSAV